MKPLFLFFICFLSLPATAQMSLCNDLSRSVKVALGIESQGEIFVLGWRDLSAGQCLLSLEDQFTSAGKSSASLDRLWVHGRDRLSSPSFEFGAGSELCVDDVFETFRAEFADSTCEKRGYIRASFTEIQISGTGETGQVALTSTGLEFRP